VQRYKEADTHLKAANASRDQYAQEATNAKSECAKQIGAMDAAHKKTAAERDGLKTQVTQLQGDLAKMDATLKSKGLDGQAVTTQIARLTEANTRVEKLLADANKQRDDDAKKVEDFRQRAVKAEIDNKSLQLRNDQLVGIIEEKDKELIKMKAAPGTATTVAAASNPPPGDVEGRVKQYDPTSGLMTITIGSDAGVLKGHTLYVYRLEPSGLYIGQMRILETRPNEAVGKMVNKPRSPVQINDKVASKIS
jgi:hypothetical protein